MGDKYNSCATGETKRHVSGWCAWIMERLRLRYMASYGVTGTFSCVVGYLSGARWYMRYITRTNGTLGFFCFPPSACPVLSTGMSFGVRGVCVEPRFVRKLQAAYTYIALLFFLPRASCSRTSYQVASLYVLISFLQYQVAAKFQVYIHTYIRP
jgi:hypothetical protein